MIGPSPAASAVLRELAGFLEFPRLAWHAPALARRPRGTGAPVLVLPGRSADDLSTAPLRTYLQLLGHAPRGWGLGINDGDFRRLVPAVAAHVGRLADRAGRKIPLVGQSLGGSIAREVGRTRPDLVSRVITLGSPIMTVQARRRCGARSPSSTAKPTRSSRPGGPSPTATAPRSSGSPAPTSPWGSIPTSGPSSPTASRSTDRHAAPLTR